MPIPPFSGAGNDLILPIVPANYVLDIEGNFDKCRENIRDLYSYVVNVTGPGAGFNPLTENGQLEVNGNFLLHRRMQEVSRTLVTPVNGNYSRNADYAAVAAGATLGIVGLGTYRYSPTVCPGWYAPLQLMPANGGAVVNGFGDEPTSGGTGMQIDIPAGARLFGVSDEAVIFQPISAHNELEKWQGRPITVQIDYETDAALGSEAELYAAWDVLGVRTVAPAQIVTLPRTGLGVRNVVTLSVTPDAAATYFEIGVRVNDPAAHTFIFRRCIVSSNPSRGIANAYPGMTPVEQLLIEQVYFRSISGRVGTDYVQVVADLLIGGTLEVRHSVDNRRPVLAATSLTGLGRWSGGNAALYAKPIIIRQDAPVSGVLRMEAANAVTADIELVASNQGGPGFANYRDWRTQDINVLYSVAAISLGNDYNNNPTLVYVGEWLNTFKPFLLT